jgi:thiosulfate/3-mercaptopyruvate sulfurtransferase
MMLLLGRAAAFSLQHNDVVQSRFSPKVVPSYLQLSSSSSSSSSVVEDSPFPPLYGKTLVSVQDCISAQKITTNSNSNSNNPKLIFIDASWYHRPNPLTNQFRIPSSEYIHGPRLPSARYIDIDSVATSHELFPSDNPNKLPHMFPPPHLFGVVMDAYNVRNEDHVVIYAKRGALFTPRMWFLFVSMGHDTNRVHLMQGSLEDYVEFGGEVEEYSLADDGGGSSSRTDEEGVEIREMYYDEEYTKYFDDGVLNVPRLYNAYAESTPRYKVSVSKASHICGKEEVLNAINSNLKSMESTNSNDDDDDTNDTTIILDTRGSSYAKGHMPSAIHLPYAQLVDPNNALILKPISEIKQIFEDRGIDYLNPNKKIILSCGSGVSVCHAYLALKQLGREMSEENLRIYDGSWTEWKTTDLPKVTS